LHHHLIASDSVNIRQPNENPVTQVHLSEMDVELVKNQYYWIEDEEDSYTPCRLLGVQPNASNQYEFESFEHGDTMWINISSIRGMIPSPGELTLKSLYDDLTEAVDISEASILWNLHKRYEVQKIYSAIGPILIAINPYCFLEEVYSQELLDFFLNASVMDNRGIPPHIWGIARNSYIQLKEKNVRQAIVISGESGAGEAY
jgi:myosin heavy subunit